MTARSWTLAGAAIVLLAGIVACKTTQAPAPTSAGQVSAGTPTTSSGGGTSIPTLVNVNLQNVLNDLSVSLNINRDNIPVTAQVPINVAASVCGVSVDALAASVANGQASCTATTTTPALTQAVQQQIASGGSVTGGPQTMGGATTNNMM
jgi:ABC-type proline/glycine betaine transport system substrate-binding protein